MSAGGVAPAATGRLTNPLRQDTATVAEGARTFVAMNCDGCHGDGATGWVAPSLVDGRWRHGGSDGESISRSGSGRPRGMPAYGGLMSATMIWNVVTWIRPNRFPRTCRPNHGSRSAPARHTNRNGTATCVSAT